MTDLEFTTYVRSILNETVGKFWPDEELESYKKVAISLVTANFWNLLFPLKKKIGLLTVTQNDRFISLPADCQKIIRIEYAETGDKLPYVQDELFWAFANQATGSPNGWTLSEGKIYLFPLPASTLVDYLRLWYLPRATTLADLPEELHPLIAVETIMAGKEKDEKVIGSLERRYERAYAAALKALVVAQVQDPEVVGETNRDEDWNPENV